MSDFAPGKSEVCEMRDRIINLEKSEVCEIYDTLRENLRSVKYTMAGYKPRNYLGKTEVTEIYDRWL